MGKKRQHYVPKLYLSNFVKSGSGLWRYNLDTKKYEQKNLDNICMNFYFYSDPPFAQGFEDTLSRLEGIIGPIIKDLVNGNVTPLTDLNKKFHLLLFIQFLESRTAASKRIAEEVWSSIAPDFNITLPKANYYSMISSLFTTALIDDLALDLIKNDTDKPFIIGDAPVIRYNYFDRNSRVVGLQCPGLIILLPLSVDLCLCLYDSVQYKMNIDANDGLIHITSSHDVIEINKLQIVNAETFLFTPDKDSTLEALVSTVINYRSNRIDSQAVKETLINDFQSANLTAYDFSIFEWRIIHYRVNLSFVSQICTNAGLIFSKIDDQKSQSIYRNPEALKFYRSMKNIFTKHDNSWLGKMLIKFKIALYIIKIRISKKT